MAERYGISGAADDYDNEALFSSGNHFNGNSYKALGGNEEHWAWGEEKEDRQRYRTWGEWRETGQEEDGKFEIEGHEPLDLECGNMPVGPALRQVGG